MLAAAGVGMRRRRRSSAKDANNTRIAIPFFQKPFRAYDTRWLRQRPRVSQTSDSGCWSNQYMSIYLIFGQDFHYGFLVRE
jgi:hypothetical protein